MTRLDFIVDEQTSDLIENLKPALAAATPAEVFRKALAIAKLAAEQGRESDGVVIFRGKEQPSSTEIAIALTA